MFSLQHYHVSQLSYAEATLSMDLQTWISAHFRALAYFGGVPQIVVPDNLKTSVTRHTLKELVLNPTYREMCDYYSMVCMPARVRTPKDKQAARQKICLAACIILLISLYQH